MIAWLDASQKGSKGEYEEKQKELEAITNPIFQTLYCSAGRAPGGFPDSEAPPSGGFPRASEDGPSIEEIDH